MSKRTSPSAHASPPVGAPIFRATADGSGHFASRFPGLTSGFFRSATFGVSMSSIGIGTYLGDNTDSADAAYAAAIRKAVISGINVIDTAINYRAQRSERALGTALHALVASGEATREQLV